ncbi:TlpA disulfide reductase family protein [Parafrigoribacterium humi]|uniref:TlpA disulfide reductase family protein n=1 Tax=Parafrigoribacterium humi TaxID=3144664 RepID=UPI0032EF055F
MKIAARVSAVALAAALVLTGCSANDSLTRSVHDNYTSADGSVTTISAQDRGAPIDFTGPSDTGKTISSTSHLGQVIVVNFWYSSCAPCRTEAALLEKSYQTLQPSNVFFVGVNTFDQPDTSRAFAAAHGVTYPSIIDVDSGAVRLAFAGKMSPTATPTTIVLDQKGRIAARVLGELESSSLLNQLVNDLLAEGAK